MGAGLFGFVFNTLRQRVNDPNNKTYWLPKRLGEIDNPDGVGKLLPLKETNWELGEITGTSGANFQGILTDQWWLGDVGLRHKQDPELAKHRPIPCPDNPWPQLAMPEVTVNGLDNLWVEANPKTEQTVTGYRSVITLRFGDYESLSQLQFEGQYCLKQCGCSAAADDTTPTQCDGWESINVEGKGNYRATFTELSVDATVEIQIVGEGSGRSLDVLVNQLTIRGATPDKLPVLTINQLDVDTEWAFMANFIWIPKAKEALTSEDGKQGLVDNLNASLNHPSNRQQLARTLTTYLNKAIDDVLGKVPSDKLPSDVGQPGNNEVDQYLFDRARYAINHAESLYYLPKLFYSITNPQLEPYQIKAIALGNQQVPGLGLTFKDFALENITMTGLSNAIAPTDQLRFKGNVIDATLLLSQLNQPPMITVNRNGQTSTATIPKPPLDIKGKFSLKADGVNAPLGGGIAVTANGANVLVTLNVSGQNLDELVITVTQFELKADANGLQISLDIKSAFKDIINQIVNQADVKMKAVAGGNEKVAGSLKEISDFATTYVKKMIAAKLDS